MCAFHKEFGRYEIKESKDTIKALEKIAKSVRDEILENMGFIYGDKEDFDYGR